MRDSFEITTPVRTLYFDIDGVVLGYDDVVKSALGNGRLQDAVIAAGIERLVCVSGWVDLFRADVLRLSMASQRVQLHRLVAGAFPSREWFLENLSTIENTDERGRALDLTCDWWYCDDWADKFFTNAHGTDAYQRELGHRIHLADAHGDGSDLLEWLRRIA